MAKVRMKIEGVIEFESDNWYDEKCPEEVQWFLDMIKDKENTFLILHSNDIGDSIGETSDFKFEIL